MTDRLYYHDSFLYDFDAEVRDVDRLPAPALMSRPHRLLSHQRRPDLTTRHDHAGDAKLRITEVADARRWPRRPLLRSRADSTRDPCSPEPASIGQIDATRRRDHMQQHSGQHVLSAAFIRLLNLPTVSFHMADDYCSIDLDTPTLTKDQVESAERLANEIILENRPINVSYVTREEAGKLGLRKLPPTERDELRLINIHDFDLTACGGTHVNQTGQIASVLLRKTEKVRQGWRVEFVAGQRAVATARRDFTTLTESAALFSANIYDVPAQARKALDEIKSLRKQREQSLEELAAAQAAALLAETPEQNGRKLIVRTFADRELKFVKLLAQKLTRQSPNAIALLATASPQPSLIFAQSTGQPHDMGALLKETMTKLGGRGGGSKDMAQGGVPTAHGLEDALAQVSAKLSEAPAAP